MTSVIHCKKCLEDHGVTAVLPKGVDTVSSGDDCGDQGDYHIQSRSGHTMDKVMSQVHKSSQVN